MDGVVGTEKQLEVVVGKGCLYEVEQKVHVAQQQNYLRNHHEFNA